MLQLLALDEHPEAIVCVSDTQATGALSATKQQVLIPVTGTGYGNIQLSEYIGLSTMRQPMYEMGRKGTKLLFDNLREGSSALVQQNYAPELVLRSTTREISFRKD